MSNVKSLSLSQKLLTYQSRASPKTYHGSSSNTKHHSSNGKGLQLLNPVVHVCNLLGVTLESSVGAVQEL